MFCTMEKHKLWLIPLCFLMAGIASICCWQQLQAQAPMPTGPVPGVAGPPGTPGAPGAALTAVPAAPQPSEPTFGIGSVLPKAVKVMRIKNWDGQVTELLRFKYKTMDNRVITVHLPAVYKKEKMTRAGWDTLFCVFAMDQEAQIDAIERNRPPDVSAYMGEFMAEIRGEVPEGTYSSPADKAAGIARSGLPSMGMQLPPMPLPLIGMP